MSHFNKRIVSIAECPECESMVTEIDSDSGMCESCHEESLRYDVFIRSWWTWEETKFNGRIKSPNPGEKTYTHYGLTRVEAIAACKEYNESHDPGELSIKAEFEES